MGGPKCWRRHWDQIFNLTGRGEIMRNSCREVRADDYIRRIDLLTLITGAITLTLAASLFV
jgi:hypothetical protein